MPASWQTSRGRPGRGLAAAQRCCPAVRTTVRAPGLSPAAGGSLEVRSGSSAGPDDAPPAGGGASWQPSDSDRSSSWPSPPCWPRAAAARRRPRARRARARRRRPAPRRRPRSSRGTTRGRSPRTTASSSATGSPFPRRTDAGRSRSTCCSRSATAIPTSTSPLEASVRRCGRPARGRRHGADRRGFSLEPRGAAGPGGERLLRGPGAGARDRRLVQRVRRGAVRLHVVGPGRILRREPGRLPARRVLARRSRRLHLRTSRPGRSRGGVHRCRRSGRDGAVRPHLGEANGCKAEPLVEDLGSGSPARATRAAAPTSCSTRCRRWGTNLPCTPAPAPARGSARRTRRSTRSSCGHRSSRRTRWADLSRRAPRRPSRRAGTRGPASSAGEA